MNGTWIETFTGKQFFFAEPRAEDVDIRDIAHSLSRQCRFGGHTRVFYSVAEHSVLAVSVLKDQGRWGEITQMYALLHDAAEAYICDLPRPIKSRLRTYCAMEKRIQRVIWEAMGLPAPTADEEIAIKAADAILLGLEGRELMHNVGGWAPSIPNAISERMSADLRLRGLAPAEAEKEFLDMFYALGGV